MKEFYNELSVKSQNGLEILKDFVFELGISCVEEREGEFIVRDEDSLEMVEFALVQFVWGLKKSGSEIDIVMQTTQKKNQDWINEYKKASNQSRLANFTSVLAGAKQKRDLSIL